MRRLVDASIPALCAIAVIPSAVELLNLPVSLESLLGEYLGRLWAAVLGVAFVSICLGITQRWRRPSLAFKLEWPALIFAAFISAVYGTAIWFQAGLRGWAAAWFIYAIGVHCLMRFLELNRARRQAAVVAMVEEA